jgi:hypothetical protein
LPVGLNTLNSLRRLLVGYRQQGPLMKNLGVRSNVMTLLTMLQLPNGNDLQAKVLLLQAKDACEAQGR